MTSDIHKNNRVLEFIGKPHATYCMRSAVIAILEVSCLHRRASMTHTVCVHHIHAHTDMYAQMTKQVCEKDVTTQNIRENKKSEK